MRYTKIALLTFGAGLVLGLAVVVLGWDPIGRVASGLMALAIIAIPVALVVDWRATRRPVPPPARRRVKTPPRRASARAKPATTRRRARGRKPAAPKR